VLLIPGLGCSPRFYAAQIPALWRYGPVTVAVHNRDDSMQGIAQRVLAQAPPRFALAGHSMGGYIAFEILRQAPERVTRLALLDTAAGADTAEQTERRRVQIAMAQDGRFAEIPDLQFPGLVGKERLDDAGLRRVVHEMADDNGASGFVRQQTAIMHRPDSRPDLAAIRCPTLVLVGDSDQLTPPERAREIAAGIRGARLVVIPDSGHMTAIERPDAVTAALVTWMSI
jgi:pimeloyl-ACP methyl ester carboxylesterase